MTSEPAAVRGGSGPSSRTGRALLLFAALGFALSPILLDLARHLALEPWALYAAAVPPLLAWAARREGGARASPRLGGALVAAALVLEIVAVGGGIVRFGRPALPLAVLGLCRALGLASARTALLAAWMVPVPFVLVEAAGLPLAGLWGELAHAAVAPAGAELALRPTDHAFALEGAGGTLPLRPVDGGVVLAAGLSGLGWLAGLRARAGWLGCALAAAFFALAALPLQLLAVGLAAAALAGGLGALAGWTLALAPWIAGAALGGVGVTRAGAGERRA